MASQWYYAVGDSEHGPISSQELKRLVDSGQISPNDQVWKEGMAEWAAAKTIPNLFSGTPGSAPGRDSAASGIPSIDTGEAASGASFSEPSFGGGGGQFASSSRMPTPRRGRPSGGSAQDYLTFKKMITPLVIQIIFWISIALNILCGLFMIFQGMNARFGGGSLIALGLGVIIFGPLSIRIYCELLIVIFSINDTLFDIKNILKKK